MLQEYWASMVIFIGIFSQCSEFFLKGRESYQNSCFFVAYLLEFATALVKVSD